MVKAKSPDWAVINIKVTGSVKNELDQLKIHPREPYHEVIAKLIDIYYTLKIIKEEYAQANYPGLPDNMIHAEMPDVINSLIELWKKI